MVGRPARDAELLLALRREHAAFGDMWILDVEENKDRGKVYQ